MTTDERIAELQARLAMYREACASMYQFAGMFIPYGIPVEILDNLSALAQGKQPPHPWKAHEVGLVERVERRGAAKELESLRSWIESEYDPTPGSPNESIDAEILRRIEGLKYRAELERP